MPNKKIGPQKYDPDRNYLQDAYEYLKICGREQTKLPKLEEFAEFIGINDDTLVEWRKKYPTGSISAASKKVQSHQKNELIDDGLFGGKEINASMAIFLLKTNHGMIETERKMLVGKDGDKLEISIVEEKQLEEDE